MKKEDFRIKEQHGKFIIQKMCFDSNLFFPFFKTVVWRDLNMKGNILTLRDVLANTELEQGYNSIETAKKIIDKLCEEPKYHYL